MTFSFYETNVTTLPRTLFNFIANNIPDHGEAERNITSSEIFSLSLDTITNCQKWTAGCK